MSIGRLLKGHLGAEEIKEELSDAGVHTLADLLLHPPKYFVRFHKYSDENSLDIFVKDDNYTELSSLSLEVDAESAELSELDNELEVQETVQPDVDNPDVNQDSTQDQIRVYNSRKYWSIFQLFDDFRTKVTFLRRIFRP